MSNLSELQDVNRRFQRTDVGLVPVDWDVRAVKEMGQVITGKALAVNGPGLQRPYLRTKNVYDGRIDISDVLTMPMTDEQFAQFRAEPGDVLLNEGQSIELVGRCALYSGEYPGPCAIQNQLLRFRARNGVSSRFASYLFRHAQQTGVFARIALQTTSIAHLGGSRFERLRLAWPRSEHEQIAIASALSDVDALLGSLDRLIAKKRDLKQAAMQQLLTGKTRLPGFKEKWGEKRIGEFTDCTAGGTPSTTVEAYWGGSIRWMNSGELNLKRVEEVEGRITEVGLKNSSAKLIPKKCVLVGLAGQGKTRGTVAINLIEVCTNQSIAAIFPNQSFVPEYLYYNLDSRYDELRGLSSGDVGRGGLNLSIIRAISVPFPSYREQQAIADVLNDVDAELVALERRRDKTRLLKQGMMQELLTGRVRLMVDAVTNVLPFPAKKAPTVPAAKPHNWQINEAVVIAVLVERFGSEQFPLGRKRYTKLSYLLHRHVERTASGYLKKAAGPYNPATRYKGPEGIAQRNGYVRTHTNGHYEGFVAAEKIADAQGYFQKWYGDQALGWLDQFRYKKNDELELIATVDMAMEDLRRAGTTPTLAAVKKVIHDHPEWEAKLSRPIFSDANIAGAMKTCEAILGGKFT